MLDRTCAICDDLATQGVPGCCRIVWLCRRHLEDAVRSARRDGGMPAALVRAGLWFAPAGRVA